ncbi:SusC/RagA family TonB-linked outer membrane protein [Solitalea lacus]|uniref:SusC/RagA family TonB-linked outer membrane protein n=1 Tax=Solitalea lacus TaxID=2911172 RepID=UPI001ED9C8F1|nr:TonB-dependent receptor [Solitalea lacus]UKJ08483.1 TonB-dependent receptor [Solitalea lacus]
MKLTLIMMITTFLQVSFASGQKVSIAEKNTSLEKVFKNLRKSTGYNFLYDTEVLKDAKLVSVQVNNVSVDYALNQIFKNQPLAYTIVKNTVVVQPKAVEEVIAPETVVASVKISGTVLDETGQPLPGVTIRVLGTSTAAVTNANGKYSIQAEVGNTLEFSFLGYKKQTITVRAGAGDINIKMMPDEKELEAVAVVAYGKQKKVSVVGSQATIKPSELKVPVRDLSTALAGRLAGIVATQRGGAPGADGAEIFIRGVATFASSPQGPLLVVDGVPDRSINNIDPEDVESFTVLKDASATAVYGTRGANGVILIHTKKGKVGKPQINAEFNQAFTQFTSLPKFLDAPQFMTLYNEGLVNRGQNPLYTEEEIEKHASGVDPDIYPNVNWYKEMFNKYGRNNRFTLNVSGGSENANYYISAGYFGEVGQFKRDAVQSYNSTLKLDRFNFTSNVGVNVTKTTKLDLGITGYVSNVNAPGYNSGNVNGIFNAATQTAPHIIPTRYSNGQWPQLSGTEASPFMYLTQSGFTNTYKNQIRSNIKVNQDLSQIITGLSASAMFAVDVNATNNLIRTRKLPTYYANALDGRGPDGSLVTNLSYTGNKDLSFDLKRYGDRRFYTEAALNYANKFGVHDVSALLLVNQSDYSDATARVENWVAAIPYRQRGFVGRANYGYKDKYYAEANFGYTGSENFSPANRFGFFPSVGAGWVVSNEKFFKSISEYIPHLKLRYSYGTSGNSSVNNPNNRFMYISRIEKGGGYSFGDTPSWSDGFYESWIGTNVRWETAYRQNLGFEMNLFRNDLELIVELFKENRNGILLANDNIPYMSGLAVTPIGNVGKTKNKGIDISLNYTRNWSPENFITFRGTFNMNKNLAVYDGRPAWKYPYQDHIGHSIGQRFGYVALGLFKDQNEIDNAAVQTGDVRPGDIRYKDLNGDGIINMDDQTAIGLGNTPRIIYGLNFGAGFKGFDVSLFFQGAGMMDFSYSSGYATTPFSQGATMGNMYDTVLDRWTPENPNPNAFYPRLSTSVTSTTNYYESTRWLRRADYLRLKSAELGYNFDGRLLNKIAVKRLRLFVNGTNLLTFSKWKFWDPELGDGRGTAYPNISTYNVGVRANFQ